MWAARMRNAISDGKMSTVGRTRISPEEGLMSPIDWAMQELQLGGMPATESSGIAVSVLELHEEQQQDTNNVTMSDDVDSSSSRKSNNIGCSSKVPSNDEIVEFLSREVCVSCISFIFLYFDC